MVSFILGNDSYPSKITIHWVYFNTLIISEEAMHCENKNHEILRSADKKMYDIHVLLCNIMNTWLDLFWSKALKSLLCNLKVLLRLIQKERSHQML